MNGYASPNHKLLKIFKQGRDKWKKKYSEGKKTIKYFKNRVLFLENSKASLKLKVSQLKELLKAQESLLRETSSKKKF